MKYVIDFTNKTLSVYVDGSLFGTNVGFGTYPLGTRGNLVIGTGPYGRALNNRYRNITILNNGSSTPVKVKFGIPTLIRSLSGGCAFADANGNFSLTDQSNFAYPTNNEWDKYVRLSDLDGKITPFDPDIWHLTNVWTWVKDTPANGLVTVDIASCNNTHRILRGTAIPQGVDAYGSGTGTTGFRPVLEYMEKEPDGSQKQTTIWH
jgi:hypothetical protein